jgi:pimeloyl-ACP methyl ester carboxylesterase
MPFLRRSLLLLLLAASSQAVDFPRSRIQTDEGRVSYQVRRAQGPALVLIPGSFNDNHQWDEVIARLDPALTLILIELRGHGESWPPPANGSIELFAQDVLAVAAAEKLGSFFVGGHSIGGMVALEVGRVKPAAVLGILSIEGWTNHRAQSDAFGPRDQNTLTPSQESARLAGRQRATGRWTPVQRTAFARIWRQWDGSEFLASTQIPVLEIYGDRGRPRPARSALGLPARDNVQLEWIQASFGPMWNGKSTPPWLRCGVKLMRSSAR